MSNVLKRLDTYYSKGIQYDYAKQKEKKRERIKMIKRNYVLYEILHL